MSESDDDESGKISDATSERRKRSAILTEILETAAAYLFGLASRKCSRSPEIDAIAYAYLDFDVVIDLVVSSIRFPNSRVCR